MWNQSFQFDVHVPELVLVRFVVEDYDSTSQNDLIGQYCLPLTSIQNGKKKNLFRALCSRLDLRSDIYQILPERASGTWWLLAVGNGWRLCKICSTVIYFCLCFIFMVLTSCVNSFVCVFPGYRHVPLLTKRGDVITSAGLFLNLMLLDVK